MIQTLGRLYLMAKYDKGSVYKRKVGKDQYIYRVGDQVFRDRNQAYTYRDAFLGKQKQLQETKNVKEMNYWEGQIKNLKEDVENSETEGIVIDDPTTWPLEDRRKMNLYNKNLNTFKKVLGVSGPDDFKGDMSHQSSTVKADKTMIGGKDERFFLKKIFNPNEKQQEIAKLRKKYAEEIRSGKITLPEGWTTGLPGYAKKLAEDEVEKRIKDVDPLGILNKD